MKRVACLLMLTFLVAGVAVAGDSETVTVEGKVLCAKCAMHEEGREECQNVLVVENGEKATHYYLAATEASEEFGPVCKGTPMVRATGTVSEKDGHMWLAATKLEKMEDDEG